MFLEVTYSEVQLIRPPMIENGLNSEQISQMKPIYIENVFFDAEIVRVVLFRVVLITEPHCTFYPEGEDER